MFRFSFDHTTQCLRVICRERDAFDSLREAFSVKNDAAFFTERYGYKAKARLYAINQFGFFLPGLLFEILSWIKTQYGGLSCVAMSQNCKSYIDDFLTPLKPLLAKRFEISNMSDDLGRNNELVRSNASSKDFRDY